MELCTQPSYRSRLLLSAGEHPRLTLYLKEGEDALNAAGELVNRLKAGQTAHEQEKTPPESGGTGGIL